MEINDNHCCGCGACMNICPFNAIKMTIDKEGFYYPKIDAKKCKNCSLCIKVCPFKNNSSINSKNYFYLLKYNNEKIRLQSRSGAAFVAFANYILDNNGLIYGCILNKNFKAEHIRITTKDEIGLMQKSKYIQSNISGVYKMIENDLKSKKSVLFSGTGCQVEAILNYLNTKKVDISNLYTIDIICHGCASPLIFNDLIRYLEKKHNSKIDNYCFRDKSLTGWDGHIDSYIINNKKYKSTIYREIFHTDLTLRPSCYNCKWTKMNRNSDITIGDPWGIKTNNPDFNDNKGVSLCIINNEKGKKLFEKIKNLCTIKEVNIKDYLQPNLIRPSTPRGDRKKFWNDYKLGGIELIIKKYGKVKLRKKVLSSIKYKIRKIKLNNKDYYLP